ncbi:hypothetical protein CRG98_014374 [Punica granatum]|uniref:Uncharacterized protein n=1 Tax=Punica granatum TaxID=22663 RepID=A0A2I0K9K8_PUNGR|nr:hypothetical protein CRG98_014374 [Punica granatum]
MGSRQPRLGWWWPGSWPPLPPTISLFSIEPRDREIGGDGGPNPSHHRPRRGCQLPVKSLVTSFVAVVAGIGATIWVAGGSCDPRGTRQPRWWR